MARWSEAKQAEARQCILEAARNAFETDGYDGASMRQIASASGVAVGTLFNYFPDKPALLHEALREDLEEIVRAVVADLKESDTPTSLPQLFTEVARPFFSYYCGRPELSMVLLRESLFVPGPANEPFREQVERVVIATSVQIEAMQRADLLSPDASSEAIVLAFLSHYYFILMSELPRAEIDGMLHRISLLARQLEQGVGKTQERR